MPPNGDLSMTHTFLKIRTRPLKSLFKDNASAFFALIFLMTFKSHCAAEKLSPAPNKQTAILSSNLTQAEKQKVQDFLSFPHSLALNEHESFIRRYSTYIEQIIQPHHYCNYEDGTIKTMLKDLFAARLQTIVTHGSAEEAVGFLFKYIAYLSHEQQLIILKKHKKIVLKWLTRNYYLDTGSDNCRTPLTEFIITYAPKDTIVSYLIRNPNLFTPEQENAIVSKHAESILTVLKGKYRLEKAYNYFKRSPDSKNLLKSKVSDIALKNPSLTLQTLFKIPYLFSEQEQIDIISKNSERIVVFLAGAQAEDIERSMYNRYLYQSAKNIVVSETLAAAPKHRSHIRKILFKFSFLFSEEQQKELVKRCFSQEKLLAFLENTWDTEIPKNYTNFIKSVLENKIEDYFYFYRSHFSLARLIYVKILKRYYCYSEELLDDSLFNQLEKASSKVLLARTFMQKPDPKIFEELKKRYNNPLLGIKKLGPHASQYLEKNKKCFVQLLSNITLSPCFEKLIPCIVDHTETEYEKNRIVLFHGQKADWILLERIYHALSNLELKKEYPSDFAHLRFQKKSSLSDNKANIINKQGIAYKPGYRIKSDPIIFTNLHLAGNHPGCNSLSYAIGNFDRSGDNIFKTMLSSMFSDLGLMQEYNHLQKKHPRIFDQLYQLFSDAIKEEGKHGRLLAISMPQELANRITYNCTDSGARIGITNTSTLAANYDQITNDDDQFALILTEEIINPEAAQQAGVKIIGFNPAFYFKTKKSLKVLEKIEEIRQLVKKIKESNTRSG